VSRAYALARERGLITGTVGRGTFVAAASDGEEDSGGEIDLTQNYVRWDPGESVAQLLRAALRERNDLRNLLETYSDPAGREDHRSAAARWLARRGFAAEPKRVVLTNGAQHGLMAVLSALTKPGDLIATECLTYTGFKSLAAQFNLRLAGLPIDSEGIIPDALDRLCAGGKVRILYLIPTLHNPTGALMSEDRRETVADIARHYNVTVLEDDIYAFLADHAPPPIAAFAPERCYAVTSLSKSVFPGLRLGFVVCPPGGAERVTAAIRTSSMMVSPLLAAIGTGWLQDGTADRIIEWKRNEMQWRWQMATRFFGMDTRDLHFAAHLWLPLGGSGPVDDFVARVRARGVRVAAGEAFAVDSEAAPRAIRMAVGVPVTRARLQQALQVISDVIESRPAPAQLI
jgi:DNA-binding transcriptional MocR family regulator